MRSASANASLYNFVLSIEVFIDIASTSFQRYNLTTSAFCYVITNLTLRMFIIKSLLIFVIAGFWEIGGGPKPGFVSHEPKQTFLHGS